MLGSDQSFSSDPLDLNHGEFQSVYLKSDERRRRVDGGGRLHVEQLLDEPITTQSSYWTGLVRAKKTRKIKWRYGRSCWLLPGKAKCQISIFSPSLSSLHLSLSFLVVGFVEEVEIVGIPDESFWTAGCYDSLALTRQKPSIQAAPTNFLFIDTLVLVKQMLGNSREEYFIYTTR